MINNSCSYDGWIRHERSINKMMSRCAQITVTIEVLCVSFVSFCSGSGCGQFKISAQPTPICVAILSVHTSAKSLPTTP